MTINRTLSATMFFFLVSSVSHTAAAAVHISNAYVNAPPPVMKMTAGFFDIHNDSGEKITLIKLSSPIASKVELHETAEKNGMMTMRPLGTLDIPPHSQVSLTPGGKHMMLHGLKQQLNPGKSITLTLEFSNQENTTIKVEIRDIRNAHQTTRHHNH